MKYEVGDLLKFVCKGKPDIYCYVLELFSGNHAVIQWFNGYDNGTFKQTTCLDKSIYGTFHKVSQ